MDFGDQVNEQFAKISDELFWEMSRRIGISTETFILECERKNLVFKELVDESSRLADLTRD